MAEICSILFTSLSMARGVLEVEHAAVGAERVRCDDDSFLEPEGDDAGAGDDGSGGVLLIGVCGHGGENHWEI